MKQSPEQRRLVRIAHRMNQRGSRYEAGRITAEGLARVIMRSEKCHYCGIGLERGQGTFDHAEPLDRGGYNDEINIVRSCYTCNRTKFTKTPEEFVEFAEVLVTCALPGCDVVFKPRYAEWTNGRAKYCSRSHAARSRFVRRT